MLGCRQDCGVPRGVVEESGKGGRRGEGKGRGGEGRRGETDGERWEL